MHYIISYKENHQQYIDIEFEVEVHELNEVEVQLPAWRPGRYELGNFAKNIQRFGVFNEEGEALRFHKIKKDRWKIEVANSQKIIVKYNYFASELNAGSTFLSDEMLYMNPVNCLLYVDDLIDSPCQMELILPKDYNIACGLNKKGNMLYAKDYHTLVDSPFIASDTLQHQTYVSNGVDFHIWIQGKSKPQWDKMITDFKKFTDYQYSLFNEFPFEEYHFLFHFLPYKAYHGVEHINSTVISLGPTYDVFESLYTELLGVSSHELYHAWNIKSIRPQEMYPYDYSKENYSRLGYVAEGVTTYMGDLILWESGVFDREQYKKEFETYLERHFYNFGRLNMSIADSSFDTWLDGYIMGVPNRKVSIYTEGALISFMIDQKIRIKTGDEHSLHSVMYNLYHEFYKKGKGYTENDYKKLIEKFSNLNFDSFFDKYINGIESMEEELSSCLKHKGFILNKSITSSYSKRVGLKGGYENGKFKVAQVFPYSIAEVSGILKDDLVISINDISIESNFLEWLAYFKDEKIGLTILRNAQVINISLTSQSELEFYDFTLI